MVMSRDPGCKFGNFRVILYLHCNSRKSHKSSVGKVLCFRSHQQKSLAEVENNPFLMFLGLRLPSSRNRIEAIIELKSLESKSAL